jgi:hypothetical protein
MTADVPSNSSPSQSVPQIAEDGKSGMAILLRALYGRPDSPQNLKKKRKQWRAPRPMYRPHRALPPDEAHDDGNTAGRLPSLKQLKTLLDLWALHLHLRPKLPPHPRRRSLQPEMGARRPVRRHHPYPE